VREVFEELPQASSDPLVEAGGGLVEKEKTGPLGEGPGDEHALELPDG
jgi:hypothetical protein